MGNTGLNIRLATALAVLLSAFGAPIAQAAGKVPAEISAAERAVAALEIQNIMGRYSAYTVSDRWGDIGGLFALDEPDVRQNVPRDMQGAEVKEYFAKRAATPPTDGVMHQHAFLSPIVEIAGDGKTAKGVWDSTGADVGNGENTANLAWVRYGVDFIKTAQGWKIWHLRVASVWRAPYGGNWQEAVKAAANQPPGGRWRYNGKGQVPLDPALPKPYYTFDPKDAY